MEYKIDYLGEPRRTSLDSYISGDYRIAIECKFTEAEVGSCSRPRLKPTDSNYESGTHEQLTCEIQIRTLLQHAYSEISHDSTYKGPFMNDKEILRQLAKSMALMEATDDYFCDIFNKMSDDKRKFANFLNELFTLYLGFNAFFKKEELDFDLTKLAFLLLDKKDIAISDIKDFCVRNITDLTTAIVPQNGYLFEQPICILL